MAAEPAWRGPCRRFDRRRRFACDDCLMHPCSDPLKPVPDDTLVGVMREIVRKHGTRGLFVGALRQPFSSSIHLIASHRAGPPVAEGGTGVCHHDQQLRARQVSIRRAQSAIVT